MTARSCEASVIAFSSSAVRRATVNLTFIPVPTRNMWSGRGTKRRVSATEKEKAGGGRPRHLCLRAHQRGGVTPVAVAGFTQRADLECIGRGRPQTRNRDRRFHACHCFSHPRQGRTTVVNAGSGVTQFV